MPTVSCTTCRQPIALLGYRTYGGWSVQRPEFGTLGRFDPHATRLLPDGRTFALDLRLDRAAYTLYREAGADHAAALTNSLLCGSWAGTLDVPGAGVWEMEAKIPASPHVEYVMMLWPHDDALWPHGEVNIIEGHASTGQTMLNLHWAGDDGQPAHDPAHITLDVTQWHRYRVEIAEGIIRWYVDGALVRELRSPHVPHATPLHMVIQCGVHPSYADAWRPDAEFTETILFRPLRTPAH